MNVSFKLRGSASRSADGALVSETSTVVGQSSLPWMQLAARWFTSLFGSRYVLLVLGLVASLFLALIATKGNDIVFQFSEYSKNGREYAPVELPFQKNYIGIHWFKVHFHSNADSASMRIYPDDEILSLWVNDQKISLDDFSVKQRRDYAKGFVVELPLLKGEKNVLTAKLKNRSNPSGFKLEIPHHLKWWQSAVIFLGMLLLALSLRQVLNISHLQFALLSASLLVSVLYLGQTGQRERTFDVYEGGGHRDYIHYIAENWSLPDPGKGWEYHQPPLYYGLGAVIKTVLEKSTPLVNDLWGRILALWFWTIFLFAAMASLRYWLGARSVVLTFASVLLCFWPAGIIHGVRIGNDVPLYAFSALSFYYLLRWWRGRSSNPLIFACLWMAAAVLTKSNGLILAASIMACIFAIGWMQVFKKGTLGNKRALLGFSLIFLAFFAFSVALNLGDNIYKYAIGESEDWLLSNVGTTINSKLKVDNKPEYYFLFDLATFVTQPFVSAWEDSTGRQYFWNYLVRSSISSEFSFKGFSLGVWGVLNGIVLLTFLATSLVYVILLVERRPIKSLWVSVYRNLPWHLLLTVSLVFLLAYRIKVPVSCNTDFRYIYPLLLSIVFYAGCQLRSDTKVVRAVAYMTCIYFPFSTLAWVYLLGQPTG